jgi:hypothetical protein
LDENTNIVGGGKEALKEATGYLGGNNIVGDT